MKSKIIVSALCVAYLGSGAVYGQQCPSPSILTGTTYGKGVQLTINGYIWTTTQTQGAPAKTWQAHDQWINPSSHAGYLLCNYQNISGSVTYRQGLITAVPNISQYTFTLGPSCTITNGTNGPQYSHCIYTTPPTQPATFCCDFTKASTLHSKKKATKGKGSVSK